MGRAHRTDDPTARSSPRPGSPASIARTQSDGRPLFEGCLQGRGLLVGLQGIHALPDFESHELVLLVGRLIEVVGDAALLRPRRPGEREEVLFQFLLLPRNAVDQGHGRDPLALFDRLCGRCPPGDQDRCRCGDSRRNRQCPPAPPLFNWHGSSPRRRYLPAPAGGLFISTMIPWASSPMFTGECVVASP